MMCYKGISFCSAKCGKTDCFRQFADSEREGARKWWSHDPDNAPIAFMDFSAACGQCKPKEMNNG